MGTRTLFLLMLIGPIDGVTIGTYSRTSQVQASFEGTKETPWQAMKDQNDLKEKVLTLKDKRELRYGWGYTPSTKGVKEKTMTVLALHGMGMGGFEMWPWKKITSGDTFTGLKKDKEPIRVRFVAIDRPGYSKSSPPPFGYSYKDFADDVKQLIESNKEVFPDGEGILVLGQSSGGPNMLALSYYLEDKVLAGASVSGDGPYMYGKNGVNAINVATARDNDLGLYLFNSQIPPICGETESLRSELGELCDTMKRDQLHGTDLKTFGKDFLPVFFKAIHVNDNWNGTLGWVNDFSLERVPWPFNVALVQAPVNIYTGGCENCQKTNFSSQGKNDDFCPICASAAYLQELLPNGKTITTFSEEYEDKNEDVDEHKAKYNHFYAFKDANALKIIVQDLIDAARVTERKAENGAESQSGTGTSRIGAGEVAGKAGRTCVVKASRIVAGNPMTVAKAKCPECEEYLGGCQATQAQKDKKTKKGEMGDPVQMCEMNCELGQGKR